MDRMDFLDRLRGERGAVRVEIMPDELVEAICREESTVTGAMGNMPVRNTGLKDCLQRNTRVCVFDDYRLWKPRTSTMRMVSDDGTVLGHNILRSQAPEYMKRGDVVFISEDFVFYPDRVGDGRMTMEMLSAPFLGTGGWVPEDSHAVIWYSSTTSSEIIHRWYGQPQEGLATAIIAFDAGSE